MGKNSYEDVNTRLPHVPEAVLACGLQNGVMIGLTFYFLSLRRTASHINPSLVAFGVHCSRAL